MKIRLTRYLNNIHFFNQNQYGFKKGKSTDDDLVNVTDTIFSSLKRGKKTTD